MPIYGIGLCIRALFLSGAVSLKSPYSTAISSMSPVWATSGSEATVTGVFRRAR